MKTGDVYSKWSVLVIFHDCSSFTKSICISTFFSIISDKLSVFYGYVSYFSSRLHVAKSITSSRDCVA